MQSDAGLDPDDGAVMLPGGPPEGRTTITLDSSGETKVSLSIAGVIASIWGGVFGISAVAANTEGIDWTIWMLFAYAIGFFLSILTFKFHYNVLLLLTDPDRRPINGPVQIDLTPEVAKNEKVAIVFYKGKDSGTNGRKEPWWNFLS